MHAIGRDVLSLLHKSNEPVTLYIDSPGGRRDVFNEILELARSPQIGDVDPRRIITVGLSYCGSAAAMLLIQGDYAIVHRRTLIHFHGFRMNIEVTVERASTAHDILRSSNLTSAIQFANATFPRFLLRFVDLRPNQRAEDVQNDLKQMFTAISPQLSAKASELLVRTLRRQERYWMLVEKAIYENPGLDDDSKSDTENEGEVIKQLVDLELEEHAGKPFSFSKGGLSRLVSDATLLFETLYHSNSSFSPSRFLEWEKFFFTEGELAQDKNDLSEQDRLERFQQRLAPLWSFVLALCHVLHTDEFQLTAKDAYLLGLVDEILGDNLNCQRLLVESASELGPS